MAYSPKNLQAFNAAFAGAMGGMLTSVSTNLTALSDYANITNVALAIAQEFDTLYTGGSSALQVSLIQQIVAGFCEGRQSVSVTPGDYAAIANGIIAAVNEGNTLQGTLVPAVVAQQTAFQARNIVSAGNVANLAAFTVAGNDGVTNVEGDIVLLAAQTTAAQNGPYVVGAVVAGAAPLTRPGWWATGSVIKTGTSIVLGGEGTSWKNTVWQSMIAADSFIVGTNAPVMFPRNYTFQGALVAGELDFTAIPVLNLKTGVSIARVTANTTAATIMYAATVAGATGLTAGGLGVGAVKTQACVAAGTVNAADISTLNISVHNAN